MKKRIIWLLCVALLIAALPIALAEGVDLPVDVGVVDEAAQEAEFALVGADEAQADAAQANRGDQADETIVVSRDATKKVYLGTTYQIALRKGTIKSCKSSKTGVAAVSKAGRLTLKKAGTAKITVRTDANKKLVLTLKVIDPTAATAISITNGKKAAMTVGDTLALAYALKPGTATSSVKWSSGNKAVASVDANSGVVTAKKAGKAVITAKTSNGLKARIAIVVKKAAATQEPETTQEPPQQPETTQQPPEGQQPTGEQQTEEGTTAATLTEDSEGQSYASTTGGENAVLVSGSTVTMSAAYVSKTGDSSSESADFYGTNAAVLAKSGATLTITGSEIVTDGSHANGVFSYGSGTTVNISDSVITTSSNNSGGIMTTGGATMNASNLTVRTAGNSSAAIRSDRGGGTVKVTGGTYSASGVGSPAIYSTAAISVSGATLSATNSEAVVIEGGNSVALSNVAISGNNATLNGQSTQKTNVLIYQSMSGDASEGASSFKMTGGTMTAGTGSMFHVTNVTTTITLENVTFNYASDSGVFLDASADAWGTSGKNGGKVTLNLVNQHITGAITMDSASSVAVSLDSASTWTLTGDSYITSFSGDMSNVNTNGYTLYVNGVAAA